MSLSIDVTGITLKEAQEIEGLLRDMEGVEDVRSGRAATFREELSKRALISQASWCNLPLKSGRCCERSCRRGICLSQRIYTEEAQGVEG